MPPCLGGWLGAKSMRAGWRWIGGIVLELSALHPDFGVELRGIGLIDVASSDGVYRATRAALEEHSVLLFRNQQVTDDLQAAFSRAFGPLERCCLH